LYGEHSFAIVAGVGTDLSERFDQITLDVDDAVGCDPALLAPHERCELLVRVERLVSRLEALRLGVTGAWDTAADWASDGALSGPAWLRANTAVRATSAHAQVRTARALRAAPLLAAAFRAGQLTFGKVRLLAPLALGATADLFARDEEVLVNEAVGLTVEGVSRLVRHWSSLADDELSRPDETAGRLEAEQSARVHETSDGAIVADLRFGPIGGAIWLGELERISEELWRGFSERERLDISPSQRRALAQIEMARRSAEWNATMHGRVVPLFVGVIDLDVLEGRTGQLCETEAGGRITPQAVHDWLAGADFAPLITGPNGAILHFGRTRRYASAKQRQAIIIRDRRCTFTG
jgi:hypothetical protein